MSTKSRGVPRYDKAAPDEALFVLRAHDVTSPLIVLDWIRENFPTAPEEKLRSAFDVALRMRQYRPRKVAD